MNIVNTIKAHLLFSNQDLNLERNELWNWLGSNWKFRYSRKVLLKSLGSNIKEFQDLEVFIKDLDFIPNKRLEDSLIHITLQETSKNINIHFPIEFDSDKLTFGYPNILKRSFDIKINPQEFKDEIYHLKLSEYLNHNFRLLKVKDLKLNLPGLIKILKPDTSICKLNLTSKDRKILQEKWTKRKKKA